MLVANNLTLIKDNKQIFSNLGFCLSVNSCLIVRGGNGTGKTSLLKILAGIRKADNGSICWGDQDIRDLGIDFGGDSEFLGHDNFLNKDFSAIDNLEFYANLNDSLLALDFAINYFDIKDLLKKRVGDLSAGQQKKILLTKLLSCPSTIWFLDEPSINLDQKTKEKLHNLINIRVKEGGIVVMATHDKMFFDLGPKLDLEDFTG